MKRPPHLVVTAGVAIAAFGVIVLVRHLLAPAPPAPWLADEAAAFARARAQHKAVAIDFTATWSVPSTETSHALDALSEELDRDFVRLRLDVSAQDDRSDALRARYRVEMLPTVLFVDVRGTELGRVTGVRGTAELRHAIAEITGRSY